MTSRKKNKKTLNEMKQMQSENLNRLPESLSESKSKQLHGIEISEEKKCKIYNINFNKIEIPD
jgi:hypothetical protein